jgi:aryl-alcohol dehydrogenase-like predicted oxidoreductase
MDVNMAMRQTRLGRNGPEVSALGLGCMGMSGMYGPTDEPQSIATIHAALDGGINLLDTGDFYGMGHNETLLRKALQGVPRDRYLIAVKFGGMRAPNGAFIGIDTRPAAVKNFLAYTLKRLGTDFVDLYQPARVDPAVPIEDTIGAIAEMVKAGYVRYIGVSEASAATIRRANAVQSRSLSAISGRESGGESADDHEIAGDRAGQGSECGAIGAGLDSNQRRRHCSPGGRADKAPVKRRAPDHGAIVFGA